MSWDDMQVFLKRLNAKDSEFEYSLTTQAYRNTKVKRGDVLNIDPDPNSSEFKDPKSIRGKIPEDGSGIVVIGDAVRSRHS